VVNALTLYSYEISLQEAEELVKPAFSWNPLVRIEFGRSVTFSAGTPAVFTEVFRGFT
jgi:hypothetical protein